MACRRSGVRAPVAPPLPFSLTMHGLMARLTALHQVPAHLAQKVIDEAVAATVVAYASEHQSLISHR